MSLGVLEFICPTCGSTRWGTSTGIRNGVSVPIGHCNGEGRRCLFRWQRKNDYRVFVKVRRFTSREDFLEATSAEGHS